MERINNNYEYGLRMMISDLATSLGLAEKYHENPYDDSFIITERIGEITGYLNAGLYSGIISDETYDELTREVFRWRFGR